MISTSTFQTDVVVTEETATPQFNRGDRVRVKTHVPGLFGTKSHDSYADLVIAEVRRREGRVQYRMEGFNYWVAAHRVSERSQG